MLHRLRHMKQFIQLSADSIGVAAIRESRGMTGRRANSYVAYAILKKPGNKVNLKKSLTMPDFHMWRLKVTNQI